MNNRLRAILLASAAVFAASGAAEASDFTVAAGTTDTTTKTVSGTDKGTVAATGTLTTATNNPTINLSSTPDTDVVITNNGAITNTAAANRAIDSSNTNGVQRTITIQNNAGALIESRDDAIRLRGTGTTGAVTLNNAGTIRTLGGGQGLDFDGFSGATVTINNLAGGVIQGGDNDGMRPGSGATVNNAGTIQSTIATVYGNYDGVDLQGNSATINNLAGGQIIGVRHGVTSDVGVIVNNAAGATITGQNGSGVGSDGTGTVVNFGRITGAISNLSPNGDGDGVDIDLIGSIDNSGVIEGLGAVGVDSGGNPNGSDGVAMGGGTIINRAGALISGANKAILIDDGAAGGGYGATTITNAGTIRGLNGPGIVLVGNFADTITNSGVISSTGSNRAIDMGAGDDTLNLATGTAITGLVDGGAGTDALNLSGTGTVGATANFETLAVAAGASWALTGAQSFTTAAISAGGRLSGLSNVGTLTVSGTIAPGNSIGTTAVAGNLTFASGSAYEAEINAAGASDLITVGGTANLAGQVSVVGATGTYSNVTSYTILTAGSISGTFSGVTSNLAFLTPSLSYSATAVTLTVRRNDVAFGAIGLTPNQVAVGTAVSGAGITSPLYLAVLPLTAAQARDSFDALSGDIHGAARGAVFADQRHLRQGVLGQLSRDGSGLWGDVFTTDAKLEANSGYAAGDEGRSGVTVGGDMALGAWRLGAAGTWGKNTVDMTARGASADVDGGEIGVYAGRALGPVRIALGGSVGSQSVDTARVINTAGLSQTLATSYDVSTSQLFGEVNVTGALGPVDAQPFLAAAWESVDSDAFAEAGGSAAVTGVKRKSSATWLTAGVRFSGKAEWTGGAVTPRLSLALRRANDLTEAAAADLRFAAGPVFRVGGPLRTRTAALVDAGVDGKLGDKARFSLAYSGEFSDNLTDHGGRASLYWKF